MAAFATSAALTSSASTFVAGKSVARNAKVVVARRNPKSLVTRAGPGEVLITVEKPLGVTLKASNKGISGGVEVAGAKGNAAKAGLKAGDYVVYCSSFFGDELWPADQLGFVRSAIQACPNSVDFIVVRDKAIVDAIDVKRLPKRPSPPRFGKKLSAAQKERASHVCVDCGYVYTLPTPFLEQGEEYVCPQCNAPRSRFAKYDVETGRAIGGSKAPLITTAATVIGAIGIAYYVAQIL